MITKTVINGKTVEVHLFPETPLEIKTLEVLHSISNVDIQIGPSGDKGSKFVISEREKEREKGKEKADEFTNLFERSKED